MNRPAFKAGRFRASGGGFGLNAASSARLIPSPGQMAPYAATKFGVVGLSHALRAAGADRGIRVSVLCPGWIDTPLLDGAWPAGLPIPPSMASSPSMREGLVQAGVRLPGRPPGRGHAARP